MNSITTVNMVFSSEDNWELTPEAKERMSKQIIELSDTEISACISILIKEYLKDINSKDRNSMIIRYMVESPLAFIRYLVKVETLKRQGYNILKIAKTKRIFQEVSDLCLTEGMKRLNAALEEQRNAAK